MEIGSSINDDWTDRPYTTGDMQDAPPLLKINSYSKMPVKSTNSVPFRNDDHLQTPIFIEEQEVPDWQPIIHHPPVQKLKKTAIMYPNYQFLKPTKPNLKVRSNLSPDRSDVLSSKLRLFTVGTGSVQDTDEEGLREEVRTVSQRTEFTRD
jgi:hypothetical protein